MGKIRNVIKGKNVAYREFFIVTGYRPILDAMKSFASDAPPSLSGGMIDIEVLETFPGRFHLYAFGDFYFCYEYITFIK